MGKDSHLEPVVEGIAVLWVLTCFCHFSASKVSICFNIQVLSAYCCSERAWEQEKWLNSSTLKLVLHLSPLSLLSCTLTHLSHKWPNTLPELRFLLLFQMVRNGRMRDLRGHTSVVNVASLGFGLSSRKRRKCEDQGKMLMQLKLQHLK